jgi:hypothetical protein
MLVVIKLHAKGANPRIQQCIRYLEECIAVGMLEIAPSIDQMNREFLQEVVEAF